MIDKPDISIVIPALNEADNLAGFLPELRERFPNAEILVVDDGSTDGTGDIAQDHGCTVVRHPYPKGNGGAIKSGARKARGSLLLFMDADGQHQAADAEGLLDLVEQGYDMAVGARRASSHASLWRRLANAFYNGIASIMTGQRIEDLTSGLRAVRADKFREFLFMLPNGFSYPTTITMAFFRSGYTVKYMPFSAAQRGGKSHINPLKDGLRFLIIIFKIGTLYSPLKLFTPLALGVFGIGISYFAYTYITAERFTNMSALLLTLSFLVFLIGLVSEQITSLMYALNERNRDQ